MFWPYDLRQHTTCSGQSHVINKKTCSRWIQFLSNLANFGQAILSLIEKKKKTVKRNSLSYSAQMILWSGDTRGGWISQRTVILFTVTLGSAGTNLAILPYLSLSLWSNRADIPFDTLYTRLSPCQRGVVVIALTFPSYYMLTGRNPIPQWHFLSLSLSLTFPLVSVSSYLSPYPSLCQSIQKASPW